MKIFFKKGLTEFIESLSERTARRRKNAICINLKILTLARFAGEGRVRVAASTGEYHHTRIT
jgi:hypothetical protein